jgi:hypothetical protein
MIRGLTRLLGNIVGRINKMPLFKEQRWNGYRIRTFPTDRDLIRSADFLRLIPYFWDTEISFDLKIQPPNHKTNIDEIWEYEWELRDLDGNILKHNRGEISLIPNEIKKTFWASAYRAMVLGNLRPHKEYLLYLALTSGEYGRSEPLKIITFTVKDRDEYYMQLLLLIIAVGFSFLLWGMSGGAR